MKHIMHENTLCKHWYFRNKIIQGCMNSTAWTRREYYTSMDRDIKYAPLTSECRLSSRRCDLFERSEG